jgi:hypothetical protein
MVQFGPTVAWNTIVGTAWFLAANAELTAPDYADVRGLVAQRFYTTVCIAVGAQVGEERKTDSSIDFTRWVTSRNNPAAGTLPLSRAQTCVSEYQLIKHAFATLFLTGQPQLVDQGMLEQLRKELVCNNGQAGDKLFQFACATTR